jgi:hypothetical protein
MAHDLLEQGQPVPGWKLVRGRASYDWKDEAKTIRHFAKAGIPAADRYVKNIISPAQAKALLKSLKLPETLFDALYENVATGNTTLAPETDKRPAVVMAPQALQLLAERLSAR